MKNRPGIKLVTAGSLKHGNYFGLHEHAECLDQQNNRFLKTALFNGTP